MSERNNKLELLGSAPIPKALMALGIPIMIGMLINALYNLVDAYFVGGLGESQMGAISVVFPWDRSWLVWALCSVTEPHPICQDYWGAEIEIPPIGWQAPHYTAVF